MTALNFANADQDTMDPAFASLLGETAEELGGLKVNSGYRSPGYNRKVGGAKSSFRVKGKAADLDMSGMDAAARSKLVRSLLAKGATGFITYSDEPNVLHVDMRAGRPHFMHDRTDQNIAQAPNWFQAIASGQDVEKAPPAGRKKITDPALLAKLNGANSSADGRPERIEAAKQELPPSKAGAEPTRRRKVTDPAVLARLNGAAEKPADKLFNADRFGPAEKGGRVIAASERGTLQGTEPSIGERVGNALYDAGKAIGLPVDRMRRDNQNADAFVRGAADTMSVGLADEIAAAGGAITGIGGKQGSYDENLEFQRATDRYDAETKPIARTGGQIAGGVATGVLAAPKKAAATWWGRATQNGLLGGVYGGAYGAGSAEGGVENRLEGGAYGAGEGVAIGLAIPAAMATVRGGYNALTSLTTKPAVNVLRSISNPQGNAIRLAERSLTRDGMTPEAAGQKMQEAIAAGDDTTMFMDVAGDNTRRLARFATNIPGEGAERIQTAVYDRQLAQPERVIAAIREGLDDPGRYFGTIDDIVTQRQTASKPLYDQFYATPVQLTRNLESLLGRGKVMRDAIKRARDLGEAEGIPSKQFFASIADDGSYTVKSVPDARQWDLIKRSLDDIIESEKTILPNGTEKLSNLGRIVSGIKREMLSEIDRVNPHYSPARKVYSSSSESLDAVAQGNKLLDADPELARRMLEKASEGDKQLMRLGLSKAMTDRVQRMKDGANTVRAIFASPKHRAVLKEVFPDEKSFNGFKYAMEREGQKSKTKQAIQGNSTTTRQAIDAMDAQGVDEALLNSLASGGIKGAAIAVVRKALSRAVVVNESTARELAKILTTTDPAVAKQIIGQMQKLAMKDARSAKNLALVRDVMRKGGIVSGTGQAAQPQPHMPPTAPPRILGQQPRQPLEITVNRGPTGGPS